MDTLDTPVSILNLICTHNLTDTEYTEIIEPKSFTYKAEIKKDSSYHVEKATSTSKKKAKHLVSKKMILRLMNDENFKILGRDNILEKLDRYDDTGASKTLQEKKEKEPPRENIVGKLQEICAKKRWQPPIYDEGQPSTGKSNSPIFNIICYIQCMNLKTEASAGSKKLAKHYAAEKMLELIQKESLDQQDDILDKFPKKYRYEIPNDRFSIKNALIEFDPEQAKLRESQIFSFFKELRSDLNVFKKLNELLPDEKKFEHFFGETHEEKQNGENNQDQDQNDDIMDLLSSISEIINCKFIFKLHPERSSNLLYQYWSEFVVISGKYENLSIISSWGTDEDRKIAKKKALTRLLLAFIWLFKERNLNFQWY